MNIATAYQLGEDASKAKESRSPALNPQIRAWLTEYQPEVGDPHTRDIFNAFVDGYRSAENKDRTNYPAKHHHQGDTTMNTTDAIYNLSAATGISMEELEAYAMAIGYRMKQGNKEFSQQGVLEAMQELQRDMEIAALNAQLAL